MRIEDLDTPAVIVDLDVMEDNIQSLGGYCRQHRLKLRPHTKTHKMPQIATKQVEAGAGGITVAKVGEAEVMAKAGLDDILIAYPVLGEAKLERLTRLALDRKITVGLDSEEALNGVSQSAARAGCQIHVLVEYDAGLGRCGVQSVESLVSLAQRVDQLPNVALAGFMFYPGQIWEVPSRQGPALMALGEKVQEILSVFQSV